MAYQRWTQEELREISENSLLAKMVESLDIDVDNWLDFSAVYHCVESGWLHHDQDTSSLATTSDGRLRLNYILSKILR